MFESTFQLREENDGRTTRVRVIAESNFFTDEKNKPVKITSNWFHTSNLDRDEVYKDMHKKIHEFVVERTKYTIKNTLIFTFFVFSVAWVIGILSN